MTDLKLRLGMPRFGLVLMAMAIAAMSFLGACTRNDILAYDKEDSGVSADKKSDKDGKKDPSTTPAGEAIDAPDPGDDEVASTTLPGGFGGDLTPEQQKIIDDIMAGDPNAMQPPPPGDVEPIAVPPVTDTGGKKYEPVFVKMPVSSMPQMMTPTFLKSFAGTLGVTVSRVEGKEVFVWDLNAVNVGGPPPPAGEVNPVDGTLVMWFESSADLIMGTQAPKELLLDTMGKVIRGEIKVG